MLGWVMENEKACKHICKGLKIVVVRMRVHFKMFLVKEDKLVLYERIDKRNDKNKVSKTCKTAKLPQNIA